MSENQLLPAETKTKESKIHRFNKKVTGFYHLHKWPVLTVGILVVAAAVLFNLNFGKKFVQNLALGDPQEFGFANVSPSGIAANGDAEIKITFNYPVTAHHVESFLSVSPNVQGTWVQGDNPNTIVFSHPYYTFYAGSKVIVVAGAGMPSDAGKKLALDQTFSFSVKIEGNTLQFVKDGLAYHFASFSASQGIDMYAALGQELDHPKAILYQAPDEKEMLQDLAYVSAEEDENNAVNAQYSKFKDYNPNLTNFKELKSFDLEQSIDIKYPTQPGLYYLAGYSGGKASADTWIVVNKSGIFFKQDDKKIILAAQDLETGNELSNIPMTIYSLNEKAVATKKSTINGITQVSFNFPNHVDMVIAKNGDELIVVPVNLPNTTAEISVYQDLSKKFQIFLSADRPLYKAGDNVKYRGIVRTDNDGSYGIPPAGTSFSMSINPFSINEKKLTDANGIISGEFVIPTDLSKYPYIYENPSYIEMSFEKSGTAIYYASVPFQIGKYVKPEYDVTVTMQKTDVLKKDVIKATIKAETFTKEAVKNSVIDYKIYKRDFYETEKAVYNSNFNISEWGGMCGGGFGFWDEYYGEEIKSGQVTTNNLGQATVEFNTAELPSLISQEITIQAKKVDKDNNVLSSAKSAIVHAGEFNLFVNNKQYNFYSNKQFNVPFYAEDRGGKKLVGKEFQYRIITYDYDPNGGSSIEREIKSGVSKTNENGIGYVTDQIEILNSQTVNLQVFSTDSKGNKIGGTRYMYFINEKDYFGVTGQDSGATVLGIVSEKNNLITGAQAELKIDSPADMKVLVTFERGRIYDQQWLDLKKGGNSYKFNVKDAYMPSITPTFSFFYQDRYRIEGLPLNVPAMKNLLNVAVTTDKNEYKPGETVKVTIKITDANNKPVVANVGAVIVDEAIFALKSSLSGQIHSSFYYFRSRSTNASSSLSGITDFPYGGGKGGGGGGDTLKDKLVDTLYWNPNLVTDANGTVSFEVPISSYLTTWRIDAFASTDQTKVGQGDQDFTVK